MEGSPKDKGPVCTMPQAADEEYHEGIAHHLPFAHTAASKGNIDVVTKPSGKTYMPTTPKLSDVTAEIGYIEVTHQT